MFVLAIQGLYRLGKKGLGLGSLWIGMVIVHRIEPVSWYNDVEQADAVARDPLSAYGGTMVGRFGAELTVSPRSVGVAMVVRGCDVTIAHRPMEQIWLIHRVDEQPDLPVPSCGQENHHYAFYHGKNGVLYRIRINGLVMMLPVFSCQKIRSNFDKSTSLSTRSQAPRNSVYRG